MLNKTKAAGVAAGLLAAWGSHACAQAVQNSFFERDRNVSVRDRPRPEYDALGVHLGGWTVLPKVTASDGYEDNIYAQESQRQGDNVATISPEFQALSNSSLYAARLYGRLQYENYADQSNNSNTTYAFGGSGEYDLTRNTALTGAASFQHAIESRTTAGTPQAVRTPIRYDQSTVDFGASHVFNRFRVQGTFDFTHYDYKNNRLFDGTFFPQDYRDENLVTEKIRGDYALSPATALYVEVSLNQQAYDQRLVSTYNRDSHGVNVQAGVDFDVSRLVRGNFQIGSLSQTFDDPRIGSVSGLGLSGRVQYFPTQLVTLTLTADRSVANTGLVESPTFVISNVGLVADYELRRNIILSGRVGYLDASYQGLARNDNQFSTGLTGTYLVNRMVGLSLQFSRIDQTSSGRQRGPRYDDDRISFSIVLQR